VADHLANMGVEQHSPLAIFDQPPNAVKSILSQDRCVVSWTRMIRDY